MSCQLEQSTETLLSSKSFIVLVIFLLVDVFVIRPAQLPLGWLISKLIRSQRLKDFKVLLDFGTAPLLGVIILLITGSVGADELKRGILGNAEIQPYSIFILFFSLTYVCISIDVTGAFNWLGMKVAAMASNNAQSKYHLLKPFLYFYALASFMTVLTSNDSVILTLTPILIAYCHLKSVPVEPFLVSSFIAANTWSVALYIGNPTNIIVADAFSLSFIEYSRWMLLPAAVCGISTLIMSLLVYRKDIMSASAGNKDPAKAFDPSAALKSPKQAIFGVFCLGLCLITLAITSFFRVPVWMITLPFAFVMLVKDVTMYIRNGHLCNTSGKSKQHTHHQQSSTELVQLSTIINATEASERNSQSVETVEDNVDIEKASSATNQQGIFKEISNRMPWKIGPFIISMFIIVETLDSSGWLQVFARALLSMTIQKNVYVICITMTLLTAVACVILNNQPMTILFTKIFMHPSFVCRVSSLELRAVMYSLIQGSNYGANFGLSGALAGLMWSKILSDKGVGISFFRFMRMGVLISLPGAILSAMILASELGSG